MKSIKSLVSLILVFLLMFGLMTGCSSGTSDGSQSSEEDSRSASSQNGQSQDKSNEETVTITWYLPGSPTQMTSDGYEAVMAEINDYLKEKLNVKLDLKVVDLSEFSQKCATVISSGEVYDIMFTADWVNTFSNNVAANAFLPLDDYLEKYAPDIVADLPEYVWKAVTVGGKIYAMPARQNDAKNDGFFLRKDIADALGITPSSYENGVNVYSMADVEELYEKIKEYDPEIIPDDSSQILWEYYDEIPGFNYLAGFAVPGVVRFSEGEKTVINQFETEEFLEYCKMVRRWIEKGYLREDYGTFVNMSDQITIERKSPKHVTYRAGYVAPHVAAMAMSTCGWDETPVPIICSEKWITTSGVTQSLNAVGVNSKHPEKAVQLYNLVYSDEYLINTIIYGLEDVNYKKISDTEIEIIRDSNYVQPVHSFAVANQFITWVEHGVYPGDIWEQTRKFGEDAHVSKIFGFIFDGSNVKTEIANCSAIYSEFRNTLLCGAMDPEEGVAELNRRMKGAGADRIIAEMQRQLDEFLANQ